MSKYAIKIPFDEISVFCKKWQVSQLSLFGSVLRPDFDHNSSDVDVLIEFLPGVSWGWEISTMRDELKSIFKRPVDLVSKRAIEKLIQEN